MSRLSILARILLVVEQDKMSHAGANVSIPCQNGEENKMATLSVNTNFGAMIALQQLKKTNMELAQTQSRISTGQKVANAKDNGAIFAIAQGMRSEVAGYGVVKQSLDRATSTTDVSLAAGEAISELLIQMREKALAAMDSTLTTEQRAAYNEDFVALRSQVGAIVNNAEFNGVNLINGSQAGGIQVLANSDGSNTITVDDEDFRLSDGAGNGGSIVTITDTATIATAADAATVLAALDASISNTSTALARLGTVSKSLEIHATFVGKLSDQLVAGIGNLVDADLAEESARLQALQTKQQLGVQALAIANQAPQIINAFFQ